MNAAVPGVARKQVLLVEDNDNDVELTRQGFALANLAADLHHVKNGRECLAFLRGEGCYVDVPRPDLVLLDLHMPVMGGRQVLVHLAADTKLRDLAVIVLTTSTEDQSLLKSLLPGRGAYIVKPVDFDRFLELIRHIRDEWLQ